MPENSILLQCYNRGCGQKFDPDDNGEEACRHHPGTPFFHDAYKGWSCCKKKCIDFTEFLNIKGCTLSQHSNVKPPEPEKQEIDKELEKEAESASPAPAVSARLVRPPFDSPLTEIEPTIADSLKKIASDTTAVLDNQDSGIIEIGTSCKNGGCKGSYQGPESTGEMCTYHPGYPVFHEGLKFWTCCQKRTTDFNVFLSQPGCTTGVHKWKKEAQAQGTVTCRWDWHQTPDYVIMSVYAKEYHPTKSYVKLNPIRLNAKLVFPKQGDSAFELDMELRGIIDVPNSSASMLGTKLEVKLKKKEPGSWSKVDYPRTETKREEKTREEEAVPDDIEDLSSIEAVQSIGKVNITEVKE